MIVDHVPVRDFAGSADPLGDMHRRYVEARERMKTPRQPVPPPPCVPQREIAMTPPPDYVMTREAYNRALKLRRENESVHRPFLRVISAVTGISITAIIGRNGTEPVLKARHIACYLIRSGTALSYTDIGRRLKHHHTSVIKSFTRAEGVVLDLRIQKSDDPVEMCDRLWSARWPAPVR